MTPLDYGLIVFAYLLGSISTAIIVCKLAGLPDPRTQGSGNPGATNVLRIGKKKHAVMTLVGDFLKGLVPVLIAQLSGVAPLTLALVAMAAFLGHLYPVFFHFKGGKGVATAFGVLLGLSWQVTLAAVATWLVVALVSRISSLSALTAAVLAPFYSWLFAPHIEFILMMAIMSLFLIWRHKANIQRLMRGEEKRFGKTKGSTHPS